MSDLNEFEDAEGAVGLGMEREVQSIMETKMIQHNFQMQTKLYNKIEDVNYNMAEMVMTIKYEKDTFQFYKKGKSTSVIQKNDRNSTVSGEAKSFDHDKFQKSQHFESSKATDEAPAIKKNIELNIIELPKLSPVTRLLKREKHKDDGWFCIFNLDETCNQPEVSQEDMQRFFNLFNK